MLHVVLRPLSLPFYPVMQIGDGGGGGARGRRAQQKRVRRANQLWKRYRVPSFRETGEDVARRQPS